MKVLITGASSGIGEALAYEYARKNAAVALMARRKDVLDAVREKCLALGASSVMVLPCDVSQITQVQQALSQLWQNWQGLDVAIVNAGVSRHEFADHLSVENCEAIFSVNINGAIATVVTLLSYFFQQGHGHIVGVSSIAGFRGLPGSAAYCASKAAFTTFLDALRADVRRRGIDISIVSPGFVKTPLTDKNEFPMPFLMTADKAAGRIVKGIDKKRPHIAFPWPMVSVMRLMRFLPVSIYDPIMSLMMKRMNR